MMCTYVELEFSFHEKPLRDVILFDCNQFFWQREVVILSFVWIFFYFVPPSLNISFILSKSKQNICQLVFKQAFKKAMNQSPLFLGYFYWFCQKAEPWISQQIKVNLSFLRVTNLLSIFMAHSEPENLKKSREKNSWNQINQYYEIFFNQIPFFAFSKMAKNQFLNWKKV